MEEKELNGGRPHCPPIVELEGKTEGPPVDEKATGEQALAGHSLWLRDKLAAEAGR